MCVCVLIFINLIIYHLMFALIVASPLLDGYPPPQAPRHFIKKETKTVFWCLQNVYIPIGKQHFSIIKCIVVLWNANTYVQS